MGMAIDIRVEMPKLPTVKPRQVVRFLEQNGFVLDHTTGSHFIFFHPPSRRRAVVPTHNRDLPKGTLISLLREAGFSREELIDFLAGRIDKPSVARDPGRGT
jgi:predicted RNA binding protein YcfA (HicA-like mRNA interferase family)